jgi:predicted RecB family endonuclease
MIAAAPLLVDEAAKKVLDHLGMGEQRFVAVIVVHDLALASLDETSGIVASYCC